MTKRPPDASRGSDAELEREIRAQRKFSLAEAVGRENADLLKGASPITRKRQAEAELEEKLENLLDDPEGALQRVLLRWVIESESLLESGYEEVETATEEVVKRILASDTRASRFVREVDAEWGRIYLERPHFDRPGAPPDRDDPYPEAGVLASLSALREKLQSGGEAE